eukprot:PhF_6_TR483/c0_g1_i2/m.228
MDDDVQIQEVPTSYRVGPSKKDMDAQWVRGLDPIQAPGGYNATAHRRAEYQGPTPPSRRSPLTAEEVNHHMGWTRTGGYVMIAGLVLYAVWVSKHPAISWALEWPKDDILLETLFQGSLPL